MDSKIVAEALNRRNNLQNYTSTFIHDAHTLGSLFTAISFSHVRRSANVLAHELARLALASEGGKIWLRECPPRIAALIELERQCTLLKCSVLND